MKARIQEQLNQIEIKYGVHILLAVESGSRAWGFASPDSDYDVRFVYCHPQQWYLSVFEQRDVIELPVDQVLDISGWDIRKALRLLWKSNAALLEWLQSPIIYRADAKHVLLNELATTAFLPLSVCHHYLAMAKHTQNTILHSERVTLKKYCYALRATLCCLWIVRYQQAPPVRLHDLLKAVINPTDEIHPHIIQLVADKMRAQEHDSSQRIPALDDFLADSLSHCEAHLPDNNATCQQHQFDATLQAIIQQ